MPNYYNDSLYRSIFDNEEYLKQLEIDKDDKSISENLKIARFVEEGLEILHSGNLEKKFKNDKK